MIQNLILQQYFTILGALFLLLTRAITQNVKFMAELTAYKQMTILSIILWIVILFCCTRSLNPPEFYYRDTIKYLLENHLFDLKSLMLSEGIPVSDFGDNEKPKFQQVER